MTPSVTHWSFIFFPQSKLLWIQDDVFIHVDQNSFILEYYLSQHISTLGPVFDSFLELQGTLSI